MKTTIPPVIIPHGEAVLPLTDILKILPHRHPFLLIDRVIDFTDTNCTAIKNLTFNEDFFQGHFPGHPVMPGVLQLEAMAQTASVLVLRIPENQGKVGYFLSADKVKFRKQVTPGDTLFIEAKIVSFRRGIGQAECRCLLNDEVASSATIKFALQ